MKSEILEIEETEDDHMLYGAVANQYRQLWFNTKEKENKLLEKLQKRRLSVVEKYGGEEDQIKKE